MCECDRNNMGTPAVDSAGTPTSPMKHSFNVQSDSSDSDDEVTVPSTFSRKISTNKRLDKSVSSVDYLSISYLITTMELGQLELGVFILKLLC